MCYGRFVPEFSYVTDHDASNAVTYCVPAKEVELEAKLLYYGVKALQVIRSLPVPPP